MWFQTFIFYSVFFFNIDDFLWQSSWKGWRWTNACWRWWFLEKTWRSCCLDVVFCFLLFLDLNFIRFMLWFWVKFYPHYWKISETYGIEPKKTQKICTRTGTLCGPELTGFLQVFYFQTRTDPDPVGTDPDPVGTDPNPNRKTLKYLLGNNFLDPKDPDPKRTDPNLTRRPERPSLI